VTRVVFDYIANVTYYCNQLEVDQKLHRYWTLECFCRFSRFNARTLHVDAVPTAVKFAYSIVT